MNNEITVKQSAEIQVKNVDEKTIRDFLFTSETKLTDKEQNLFLQMAVRHNLDPFKRQIYAIKYGSNFNIVTGYQTYIEKATSSGLLDGWSCEIVPTGAKITIYRKDFKYPFVWEVSRKEFDKGQSSWKTMPDFMIKKVAIGQGFRLAFPNELGGMPYLQEEITSEHEKDTIDSKPPTSVSNAKVIVQATNQPVDDKFISTDEIRVLKSIMSKNGVTRDEMVNFMKINYGIESSKQILKTDYRKICQAVEMIAEAKAIEASQEQAVQHV